MKRPLVNVGVVALLLGLPVGCSSSSSGSGARAASACLNAWSAIADYQAGTRDVSSAVAKLRSAAGEARDAAASDAKYEPIAQWITGAEGEVAAGAPGRNAGELYAECGPGRK